MVAEMDVMVEEVRFVFSYNVMKRHLLSFENDIQCVLRALLQENYLRESITTTA